MKQVMIVTMSVTGENLCSFTVGKGQRQCKQHCELVQSTLLLLFKHHIWVDFQNMQRSGTAASNVWTKAEHAFAQIDLSDNDLVCTLGPSYNMPQLLQAPASPPDPSDEEATAFYNAQQGLRGKSLTVKRTMAVTRRRPVMPRS